MRRLSIILLATAALFLVAQPALAQEGDPLAGAVLLPGVVGWGLLGLAVVLVILFRLWTSRGPR
jgi:hypothetical protein